MALEVRRQVPTIGLGLLLNSYLLYLNFHQSPKLQSLAIEPTTTMTCRATCIFNVTSGQIQGASKHQREAVFCILHIHPLYPAIFPGILMPTILNPRIRNRDVK